SPSPFPIPVEDSDSFFDKSDTSLSYSNNSLPEFETFSDHTEETRSGSTITHADNSLPEYDSFHFEIEPDQGEFTSIVMEDILGEPHVHMPNVLPTHPTLMLDSDCIPSDDSLRSNLEVSFPFGTRNKIFDPGIFLEFQSKRFLSWELETRFLIRGYFPFLFIILIRSLENKILVPLPDISLCCVKCGTPVDGPYCRGCAFLRKKFEEDLLTYCGENETSKDFEDISESSDDNTNVVNALREPIVVNQDPSENSSHLQGSEVRKKEQAYEEEKYYAACRFMLSVTCDDEDDYIPLGDIIARNSTFKAIIPDLSIEEPNDSLNMGDEHLDTIPPTESDKVIKSSVENLVPILSEFEGMSDDTSNVPTFDNNCVNVVSDFVESLVNRDTSIVYSSKIDPIFEEFAGELAHIAPIPPGIVEANFDPNDNTSSDDDDFEVIEYISLEEVNDVDQEEKEFDLEDIFQIQDVILREKLLNVHRLISNIESLKDNPIPIPVTDSDSSDTFLSFLDNSLPEFESFSDYLEETRSGSTTTHANYSLPKYESFHFDNPSLPRPLPEPSDVENLELEFNNFDVLNNNEPFDPGEGENVVFLNVEEDDSFTFTIRTFLPFVTYPEASLLSCFTGNEDLFFDPGIITFHFLKTLAFL
ncbi:hypothetical protein Tco_0333514, partial [Tanacetum coccineum]